MAILKKLLLGLVALLVLGLVIGFFLPAHQTVSRSAVFNAKPAVVYAYLNGFRRFNEWSPWAERDPNTRYGFDGPPIGVGAMQTWESKDPNVGSGSQKIIEVQPNALVKQELRFSGWDTPSFVSFIIAPDPAGTKLTWSMEADLGKNPVNHWFGLAFDKMVGKDYEKGLANLKPKLEALPTDEIAGIDITLVKTEATPYLYVSDSAGPADTPAKLAAAYARIGNFITGNNLKRVGAPIALTRNFDEKTSVWDFDAGMPIAAGTPPAPADLGIQYGSTYAGYALRATHHGAYADMQPSYAKLIAYKTVAGLNDAAGAWEEYESDPASTPAEQLIAQIYWPVK